LNVLKNNQTKKLQLLFESSGWYLHFSAQFVRNLLFELKNIELGNKRHLWKTKTEIMQHVVKMQQI
jgi:hypothetical protein